MKHTLQRKEGIESHEGLQYKHACFLRYSNPGSTAPQSASLTPIPDGWQSNTIWEEEFLGVPLTPPKRVTHFPRLEEGNVPINTSWYGMFWGISRVLGESWTARRYPSADSRPIRKADCVSKKNPLQNTEENRREI
ncbi:hypothetical protein TNCV_4652821 [Trichonephila clavipes]|nr:hypothetical protein TNCV_4652821 [Trichonephila clavipes]